MQAQASVADALVVGAGPAGLTAAIYLGRYRRRCVVLADGDSRARWIPTSHNIPGFISGIGGSEFLAKLRDQALQYGAEFRDAHVTSLSYANSVFTLSSDRETFYGRCVLLATGVKDQLPAIAGAREAISRSLLRVCPVCDAYEAIDKRIAVLGDGALGEREAAFLSNYSDEVTLLHIGPRSDLPRPREQGIERVLVSVSDLKIETGGIVLTTAAGKRTFDVLYLALGCRPQHDLARSLGALCDEYGALTVNAHQETTVSRLYAAGDVVRGLNQVVIAAAESAIAATDIHNQLRGQVAST